MLREPFCFHDRTSLIREFALIKKKATSLTPQANTSKKKQSINCCKINQAAGVRTTTTTSFICMTITKYYSIAEAT